MANLLQVKTPHGPIKVEVSLSDTGVRQVTAGDKVKQATQALKEGLDQLVAVAKSFSKAVADVGKEVAKAELELGLELTAEGKFFIASAGAKATFSAKLEFDLSK